LRVDHSRASRIRANLPSCSNLSDLQYDVPLLAIDVPLLGIPAIPKMNAKCRRGILLLGLFFTSDNEPNESVLLAWNSFCRRSHAKNMTPGASARAESSRTGKRFAYLVNIKQQTLVASGNHDVIVYTMSSLYLAQNMPNARLNSISQTLTASKRWLRGSEDRHHKET
jgi:pimeloyl-ACP methyl ester carboxylesterase